jgi:hypothetical protein
MRPTGTPIQIEDARHERQIREYRDALRSVSDIARRALSGNGERRETALMNISRVSAAALQEGTR